MNSPSREPADRYVFAAVGAPLQHWWYSRRTLVGMLLPIALRRETTRASVISLTHAPNYDFGRPSVSIRYVMAGRNEPLLIKPLSGAWLQVEP